MDESNMTLEEITCKRIAEIILENIQGEYLVTQVRDAVKETTYSALFDPTSIATLSRRKSTKKGDIGFETIAPTLKAIQAQKGNKGRANKPRAPPKIRSSFSKKIQGRTSLKPSRALVVNPSRLETSDHCPSEDLIMDRHTSYTSSEVRIMLFIYPKVA
jgi:hypothetical protein